MMQRMQGKVVLVMGAGSVNSAHATGSAGAGNGSSSIGTLIGNGRASAMLYAKHGIVLPVDGGQHALMR